jgi:ubiquinone/menaquinone biosynthesis C-methylase UbiE
MKRIHAFEFEDLQWFPQNLRNYATDFLQFGANKFDIYKGVIPILKKGIDRAGNNTIVDIASGGGGGLVTIARHLKQEYPQLKIILSDYFPHVEAFKRTQEKLPETFQYISYPVDAMNVPEELQGFRTQFLSLHHFKPDDAMAILQNAVDRKQPIGIFEGQQRNIKSLIPMLLSPLTVLFMTPFIRPFKIDRIIFTYLFPVLPLFIMWDGIISVLRTYTQEELHAMIRSLRNSESFTWETGVAKGTPDILYLLGLPRE